jgi:hypothetical protein
MIEKPKEVIDKVTTALKPQSKFDNQTKILITAAIIGVGLYLIID